MSTSASEKTRQAAHEKKRKEMMDDFERQKSDLAKEGERDRTSSDRFVGKSDSMEESLKMQTVGLVRLEDFQQKRAALEEEKRRIAARTSALQDDEPRKRKKRKTAKLKLSFDDEEAEDGDAAASADADDGDSKKSKFGKNPTVDTSFLPDREREEADREEREKLRQEWLALQESIKKEDVEITYSYWDGSGHRKEVTCKKGDTIAQFLEKVRAQWPELRSTSIDNLLYVKEDLMLPAHLTFYDLIVTKARGKSGPLFDFGAHDDVRLLADATIATDSSHAGKVVTRTWYNTNKHIFPASRWEAFVAGKTYSTGKYTVKS